MNAREQADGVENLRAAIGLVGRNAHLRHDLEQALVDRLDEALDGLIAADRLRQLLGHRGQSLEGEIGIDRFGAVAGETGEMMDLARFAGLDDEADGGAQSLADEVMMDGRRRQKGRNRDSIRTDHAVGKDDDVVAAVHRRFRALAKPLERVAHAGRALLHRIGDVEGLGVERIPRNDRCCGSSRGPRWSGSAGAPRGACASPRRRGRTDWAAVR